jgi:hypothetical protein
MSLLDPASAFDWMARIEVRTGMRVMRPDSAWDTVVEADGAEIVPVPVPAEAILAEARSTAAVHSFVRNWSQGFA